jgi:hypothetical protein
VPVLVTTWAYSNYPFALALPSETTEAILHGLVAAFHFFGCVPPRSVPLSARNPGHGRRCGTTIANTAVVRVPNAEKWN